MIINRPGKPLLHVHVYTMRLRKYSGEFFGENLFFIGGCVYIYLCSCVPSVLQTNQHRGLLNVDEVGHGNCHLHDDTQLVDPACRREGERKRGD